MGDYSSFQRLPQTSKLEIEELTKNLNQASLKPYPLIEIDNIKTDFIDFKLDPTFTKDAVITEKKLSLSYSDKLFNQSLTEIAGDSGKNFITQNSKKKSYKSELIHEFEELLELRQAETKTVDDFTGNHFKENISPKGIFESPEACRLRNQKVNKVERENFIKQKRPLALAEELRFQIRNTPEASPEGFDRLHREEKVQNLIEKSEKYLIDFRNYFFDTPSLNSKNPKKIAKTKAYECETVKITLEAQHKSSLFPHVLFSEEALASSGKARTIQFNQFKSSLTSAKNKEQDKIDVKMGYKMKFRSMV